QAISDDITCTRKIELDNGRMLSAVGLQKEYLQLAREYFEFVEPDPLSEDIMEKWEYVLTSLEKDPMQLDKEVDWVIKKKLIDSYVSTRNLRWDSSKVLMLDLQYHNIRTDKGLYYLLEKDKKVKRMVTDKDIEHAMYHPPETTRAKFRSRFIKLVNEKKILCGVNWSYIQVYEPHQKLFLSTDPLEPEFEEASRMIYSI
ncbi:MAG: proteasome accessory factor PafA2 family protein, partial [Candidatus Poribacteria bacterium]